MLRITESNNINFSARFVNNTVIQKRAVSFYKPISAAIVELSAKDANDINALRYVIKHWESPYIDNHLISKDKSIYYLALTTQHDKFESINPKTLLGIVKCVDTGFSSLSISLLHGRPDTNYKSGLLQIPREYKGVGESLIKAVKSIKDINFISLISSPGAKRFYKKQGFKSIRPGSFVMDYVRGG